jgi:hypothetical protein
MVRSRPQLWLRGLSPRKARGTVPVFRFALMARLNVLSTLCTQRRGPNFAEASLGRQSPRPAPPSGWKRGEQPVRRRPRKSGGRGRIRTCDFLVRSEAGSPLPYTPLASAAGFEPAVSSSTMRRVSRFPTRPGSRQNGRECRPYDGAALRGRQCTPRSAFGSKLRFQRSRPTRNCVETRTPKGPSSLAM